MPLCTLDVVGWSEHNRPESPVTHFGLLVQLPDFRKLILFEYGQPTSGTGVVRRLEGSVKSRAVLWRLGPRHNLTSNQKNKVIDTSREHPIGNGVDSFSYALSGLVLLGIPWVGDPRKFLFSLDTGWAEDVEDFLLYRPERSESLLHFSHWGGDISKHTRAALINYLKSDCPYELHEKKGRALTRVSKSYIQYFSKSATVFAAMHKPLGKGERLAWTTIRAAVMAQRRVRIINGTVWSSLYIHMIQSTRQGTGAYLLRRIEELVEHNVGAIFLHSLPPLMPYYRDRCGFVVGEYPGAKQILVTGVKSEVGMYRRTQGFVPPAVDTYRQILAEADLITRIIHSVDNGFVQLAWTTPGKDYGKIETATVAQWKWCSNEMYLRYGTWNETTSVNDVVLAIQLFKMRSSQKE
jgi:hypothetical protein